MSALRKRLIVILCALILVCLVGAGGVFAYYKWNYSYAHVVSIGEKVTFLLDGNTYGENENTDWSSLQLVRGESKRLEVKVELKSANTTRALVANYKVALSSEGDLANAIEVYAEEDGEYSYVGMLGDWLDSPYEIDDYFTLNSERTYSFILRYSEGASTYYDGKTFSLSASATSSIVTTQEMNGTIFVGTSSEFKKAAESVDTKKIILLGDVALAKSVNLLSHIDVQLNGYTLTVSSDNQNYLIVAAGENASGQITGGYIDGKVVVGTKGGDASFIKISAWDVSCKESDEKQITTNIQIANLDIDGFVAAVQSNAAKLSANTYVNGDTLPLTRGVAPYFYILNSNKRLNVNTGAGNISEDDGGASGTISSDGCVVYENGEFYVQYSASATISTEFRISLTVDNNATQLVKGYVTLQGNSAQAYWQTAVERFYDESTGSFTISSDAFFPVRDKNNCTFSWITSNDEVLSSDGVIAQYGYENLPSWAHMQVRVTVICAYNGEQYGEEITFDVCVLDKEARTDLCFVCEDIQLNGRADLNTVSDFYQQLVSGVLTAADMTVEQAAKKTDLTGVKIELSSPDGAVYGEYSDYIEIIEGELFPQFKLINQNEYSAALEYNYTLTFVYADGEVEKRGKLIITGQNAEASAYDDATTALQTEFEGYKSGRYDGFISVLSNYKGGNVYYEIAADGEQSGVPSDYKASAYVLIKNSLSSSEIEDGLYVDARESKISLLFAKAPPVDNYVKVIAYVFSAGTLFDGDGNATSAIGADGTPTATAKANAAKYTLEFSIDGILHNTSAEIASTEIYNYALANFDANGDGRLTATEAAAAEVIELAGKSISSLKGLEYFTGLKEIYLSGNSITDISPLADLYDLTTVDLSGNSITDISALQYLDGIRALNLSNNNIVLLDPISALTSIEDLDISLNDSISDFSALENYNKLNSLKIYQSITDNIGPAARYYMARIASNCPNLNNTINMALNGGDVQISEEQKSAAEALYELSLFLQVSNTLYVPFEYNGLTLSWTASSGSGIDFDNDNQSWTVTRPLVDEIVTFSVAAYSNGTAINVARAFDVTLLAGTSALMISYAEGDATVTKSASAVVTDKILLSALASRYSPSVDDPTIDARSTPAAQTELKLVGVTSLKGMQYFTGLSNSNNNINLSSSVLDNANDISYLTQAGIQSVTLGAQTFDFSCFLADDGTTSLKYLDASRCYNLDDEDVQKDLFALYLANPDIKIYLETPSSNADNYWQPLTKLAAYFSKLPSVYNLTYVGQTADLLELDNSELLDITIYKTDITFSVSGTINYIYAGKSASSNIYVNISDNLLTYKKLAPTDTTIYAVMTFKCVYGNLQSKNITFGRTVQINVSYDEDYTISGFGENGDITYTVRQVFPGRDLRAAVLAAMGSSTITLKQLKALNITSITVDASDYESVVSELYGKSINALCGLRYLKNCTSLTINRDAYFGDCADLINITSLKVRASGVDFSQCGSYEDGNGNTVSNVSKIVSLNLGDGSGTDSSHNFYVNWGDKFACFTSLTDLRMTNCAQTSWEFLKSYSGSGFTYLYLFAVLNNGIYLDYSNKYSNNIIESGWRFDTWGYDADTDTKATLADMYKALSTGTESAISTLSSDDDDSDIMTLAGDEVTYPEYYVGLGVVDYYTTDEFDPYDPETTSGYSNDYSADETEAVKLSTSSNDPVYNNYIFNYTAYNFILDLGVKVNGNLVSDGYTQISKGSTVSLPLTTGEILSTSYGDSSSDTTYLTRDYAIRWYAIGDDILNLSGNNDGNNLATFTQSLKIDINNLTNNTPTFVGGASLKDADGNIVKSKTATVTTKGFLILYGVIGGSCDYSGWYDSEGDFVAFSTTQRDYAWVYVLEVTDGEANTNENSYINALGSLDDYALKFFIALHIDNLTDKNFTLADIYQLSITYDSGTKLKLVSVKNGNSQYNAEFKFLQAIQGGNNVVYRTANFIIYSLEGLVSALPNLTVLNIEQGGSTCVAINDISPLAKCTTLKEITLSGLGLTSLPDLSALTNLNKLTLKFNNISSVGGLANKAYDTISICYDPSFTTAALTTLLNSITSVTYLKVASIRDTGTPELLNLLNNNSGKITNIYYAGENNLLSKTDLSNLLAAADALLSDSSFNVSTTKGEVKYDLSKLSTTDYGGDYTYKYTADGEESSTKVTYFFESIKNNLSGNNYFNSGATVYVKISLSSNSNVYAYYPVTVYNSKADDITITYNKKTINSTTGETEKKETTLHSSAFDGILFGLYDSSATTFEKSSLGSISLKNFEAFGYSTVKFTSCRITAFWDRDIIYDALTTFTIEKCALTTDDLFTILKTCPKLTTLNLYSCYGIEIDLTNTKWKAKINPLDESSQTYLERLKSITTLKLNCTDFSFGTKTYKNYDEALAAIVGGDGILGGSGTDSRLVTTYCSPSGSNFNLLGSCSNYYSLIRNGVEVVKNGKTITDSDLKLAEYGITTMIFSLGAATTKSKTNNRSGNVTSTSSDLTDTSKVQISFSTQLIKDSTLSYITVESYSDGYRLYLPTAYTVYGKTYYAEYRFMLNIGNVFDNSVNPFSYSNQGYYLIELSTRKDEKGNIYYYGYEAGKLVKITGDSANWNKGIYTASSKYVNNTYYTYTDESGNKVSTVKYSHYLGYEEGKGYYIQFSKDDWLFMDEDELKSLATDTTCDTTGATLTSKEIFDVYKSLSTTVDSVNYYATGLCGNNYRYLRYGVHMCADPSWCKDGDESCTSDKVTWEEYIGENKVAQNGAKTAFYVNNTSIMYGRGYRYWHESPNNAPKPQTNDATRLLTCWQTLKITDIEKSEESVKTTTLIRYFVEVDENGFVANTAAYSAAYSASYITVVGGYNCVAASEFFISGSLLNKLNGTTLKSGNKPYSVFDTIKDDDGNILGYVLTLATQRLDFSGSTLDLGSTYVTSIEGLQLLTGLKAIKISKTSVSDLSPLTTLSLTSFEYISGDSYDFGVTDFTPLYEGSGATLTTFKYKLEPSTNNTSYLNSYSSVNITDLSFLAGMTALKEVYICDKNGSSAIGAYAYLYTPSFAYVVATLYERGAVVYVGNGKDICGLNVSDYYTTTESGSWLILAPLSGEVKAADILAEYATDGYDGSFKLNLSADESGFASVNAAIDYGGEYYLVYYTLASGSLSGEALESDESSETGKYYLTADFTYNGKTISAGEEISAALAEKLLADSAFISALRWGQIELKYAFVIKQTDSVDRLVAGVKVDGVIYERTLQLA
jgi:hypothetical protein